LNFGVQNIVRMLPTIAAITVVNTAGIKTHVDTFTAYVICTGVKANELITSRLTADLFR
jgi:hypothetical protein